MTFVVSLTLFDGLRHRAADHRSPFPELGVRLVPVDLAEPHSDVPSSSGLALCRSSALPTRPSACRTVPWVWMKSVRTSPAVSLPSLDHAATREAAR